MNLDAGTRAQIDKLIHSQKVVLFMKGTREAPQCGFSAALAGILDGLLDDYGTVNVLAEPQIREGIKTYSNWPTLPQLYVDGEFVGGSDIVREMHLSGELRERLGLPPASEASAPHVTITDSAARVIREAMGPAIHRDLYVQIDTRFKHTLSLGEKDERMIRCEANGIWLCFDPDSATRADGLLLDTDPSGQSLRLENPNQPKGLSSSPASE